MVLCYNSPRKLMQPSSPLLCQFFSEMHCFSSRSSASAAAAAKSIQSCPTLCDSSDGSPPGSAVPGILQARTLEWVAISFFNAWKWKVKMKLLNCVWLFVTPWNTACQAFLSITNSQSSPKPMPIELVMPSNHLILCHPLLLLPSIFPTIRVFSSESALLIK